MQRPVETSPFQAKEFTAEGANAKALSNLERPSQTGIATAARYFAGFKRAPSFEPNAASSAPWPASVRPKHSPMYVGDAYAGHAHGSVNNNKSKFWSLGIGFVFFVLQLMHSPQASAQQSGDVFSHSTPSTQPDHFSGNCNNENNPYTGMNPLVCKGISQPVDNRNQCSLPRVRLLRRIGNMCYYCQSIPRINGIIAPISQIGTTYRHYRCGADQADNCAAICSGGPASNAVSVTLPAACQQANPPAWCPRAAPEHAAPAQNRLPFEESACAAEPSTRRIASDQPTGAHVRGSLSDEQDVAVSMEEFIQFVSGTSFAANLDRLFNGKYGAIRDSSGRVVRDYRYVRTPFNPSAIIDMRHFMYVGPLSQQVGTYVEQIQGAQHQASAYQRQDYYSNALGEYFRDFYCREFPRSWVSDLRAFFGYDNQPLIRQIIKDANALSF